MALHDLGKKVKKQFSDFLEMPGDVMMDMPKITMVGDIKLYIENHRGIIEYSSTGVRVSVMEGEVAVAGEGLMLRNVLPDEICVEGKIKSLSFL
ncbi:sporulation protein YqfC [Pelotomaculum propionicicum]|uniref:sporulation protein YqfC n=1 Tax=Pelotomaculum propionicicum TaxID=258475 RepID=UPI003B7720AA